MSFNLVIGLETARAVICCPVMAHPETETVDVPRLETLREEAAEIVREFSRSQVEDWRKIPALALEADGRTGHSDAYSMAYQTGLWTIKGVRSNGWYMLFVDCETGELVFGGENLKPASDEVVIRALEKPEELDAAVIVEQLEAQGKEPHGSYYSEADKVAWREKVRQETGVTSPYVRTKNPPPIDWGADM